MKCWAWGVWALGIEKPRGGSRAPDTTRKGGALLAGGPERSGQEVAGARCKLQHGENRRAGDRRGQGKALALGHEQASHQVSGAGS